MSGIGPKDFPEMVDAFGGHSLTDELTEGAVHVGGGGEMFTDKYFASCQDCPQAGGWIGPNRRTREEAQADADAHNDSHPGHRAGVS
jgi:hypothetical protein